MLTLGTGLTCSIWDVGGAAPIYMTHPFWFATPQNRWQELVWPNLPSGSPCSPATVLEGFYNGQSTPYTARRAAGLGGAGLLVDWCWSAPSCGWGSASTRSCAAAGRTRRSSPSR